MSKVNEQDGKHPFKKNDVAEDPDFKKKKCRIINIYLFGFQGSSFSVIRELREFFYARGYKPHEVSIFNFPDNEFLPDQTGAVIFQVNEMRFSKRFGQGIKEIEVIRGVPQQVQYIPAAFFLRLSVPDEKNATS